MSQTARGLLVLLLFFGGPAMALAQRAEALPGSNLPPLTDSTGDPLPRGALIRCGTTRLRHHGTIACVALSPDGKLVATAGGGSSYSTTDHPIRLWDTSTGKELRQFQGHTAAPGYVLFSPDGKTLASFAPEYAGTEPGDKVRLWDVATGKQLHLLDAHRLLEPLNPEVDPLGLRMPIVFSPDGRTLASAGRDHRLRLWDVSRGKELRSPSLKDLAKALAFSPEGNVLVAAERFAGDVVYRTSLEVPDRAGTIPWLEWPTAKQPYLPKAATILASSCDQKRLAIGQGKAILLWDIVAGKELRRFPLEDASLCDPEKAYLSGSFSADGSTLAVPDGGRVRILDTRTGKESRLFPGHSDEVVFLAFSPDGQRLISTADRSIRTWDPRTGKELSALRGHKCSICGASLTADGKIMATGGPDGTIRLWDLEARKEVHRLLQSKIIAVYLERGLGDFVPLGGYPALAFSPDGKRLAASRLEQGSLWLFDVASGKQRLVCNHARNGQALGFGLDGQVLAELSATIALYDADTGQLLREFKGMQNVSPSQTGLAISPDGRIAATGYREQPAGRSSPIDTVSLWEMVSGKLIAQYPGHQRLVGSVAFSSDGRLLASGSWDGTVRVWDIVAGRELRKFEGHRGGVLSVAFSPDSRLLASGGSDSSILIWDIENLTSKRVPSRVSLGRDELNKLWEKLGDENASVAYPALWKFVGSPSDAVPFLKKRLLDPPVDEKETERFIAGLDADSFEVREQMMRTLRRLGQHVEAELRKALANKPSAEMRRRLEQLLEEMLPVEQHRAAELLLNLRAAQAVEYAGTKEARQVLQALAEREPKTPRGLQAQAALHRLEKSRP